MAYIVRVCGAVLHDSKTELSADTLADLVALVYEHAAEHEGQVSEEYIRKLVKLMRRK